MENLFKKNLISFIFLIIIISLGFLILVETEKNKNKIETTRFETEKKEENFFDPLLLKWEKESIEIPWSPRDAAMAVVFKNKIWLMGGVEGGEIKDGSPNYGEIPHKSDIWVSENGKDWQLIKEKAPWGKRRSAGIIVFSTSTEEKIWLMGGWAQNFGETKNDIWISEDGENWKLILPSAEWEPREGHAIIVFKNKIFLTGGVDFYKRKTYNDVWYSEDGINWIEATSTAPWSKRYDHTLTVFKDKLWLIGGLDFGEDVKKDIWVSEDGVNWKLVTDNPPWFARHGHIALEYKEKLWIIGGWSETENKGLNDTWYSSDGLNWEKTKEEGLWLGREDHSAVIFNDKIWLLGGMADAGEKWIWQNDIWYSKF